MDLNVNAFRIVNHLTTEAKDVAESKRSSAARAGGLAGGHARARKLSPERRKEIAEKASEARWKKARVGTL